MICTGSGCDKGKRKQKYGDVVNDIYGLTNLLRYVYISSLMKLQVEEYELRMKHIYLIYKYIFPLMVDNLIQT